ncbi:hypothetical protein ACFV4N_21915, partial [Actinosynnema sp. NPDC059797]
IVGVAAGSMLRLRFPQGPPDPRAWHELLLTGIGDRIAEGYGEVVVDAPLLAATTVRTDAPTPPARTRSTAVGDLPDRVRTAVVADRTRDMLPATRAAGEYTKLVAALRKLSRSQRGEWRAACVAAAVAGGLEPLTARIDRVTAGRLPRRQSERVLAHLLNCLIGRRSVPDVRSWWTVLEEHGVPVTEEPDRAAAIVALVADALDGLRRDGEPS